MIVISLICLLRPGEHKNDTACLHPCYVIWLYLWTFCLLLEFSVTLFVHMQKKKNTQHEFLKCFTHYLVMCIIIYFITLNLQFGITKKSNRGFLRVDENLNTCGFSYILSWCQQNKLACILYTLLINRTPRRQIWAKPRCSTFICQSQFFFLVFVFKTVCRQLV